MISPEGAATQQYFYGIWDNLMSAVLIFDTETLNTQLPVQKKYMLTVVFNYCFSFCPITDAVNKLYIDFITYSICIRVSKITCHNKIKASQSLKKVKLTSTFNEVDSSPSKIVPRWTLGLSWRSICFPMHLNTVGSTKWIIQVLKRDLPKQRLPTQPAPPVDKDKPTEESHRISVQLLNNLLLHYALAQREDGSWETYLILEMLAPVAATCAANLFSAARALYNQ